MRICGMLTPVLALALAAAPPSQVSLSRAGWQITADTERFTLTVAHERVGTILVDCKLGLRSENGLAYLKAWSAEESGDGALSITASVPTIAFRIEPVKNALKVSSTATDAVFSARAPASRDRIPVRLLDPRGTPVTWVGTNEVGNSYGGRETRNQSFLPAENPEIMYLALGQVSSANLHSLFDRKSDTAIDFPGRTVMKRDPGDPDSLKVTMSVPGTTVIRIEPDYYTGTLGAPVYVPFDEAYFPRPPAVWGSWTSYYDAVSETDIVRNTDWISANLKPYGFEYVQLDDGFDRGKDGEHYWIERWDQKKFPHGPQWLTNYIRSKGLRPGLWIVPNAYAGALQEHPDWYLRDKEGGWVLDYHTPSLDSTHPGVLEFLKREFTTLRSWGFEYFKFDGEHALPAYAPVVDRSKLYDRSVDPIVAYRNRLRVIRDAVGPTTFIEGCPAGTPLNGIGFFNSYFTGHDVYNSWQGMYALFSSINANAFLNHILVYVMPGEGIEVGPPLTPEEATRRRSSRVLETARTREEPLKGFGTTIAEARTLVTYLALTGVSYPVASVLPELPAERVNLLKMTLPTMPVMPVDLFSRGTDMQWDKFKHATPDTYIHNYPEILDLKVNSVAGSYDVVGITNWRSGTLSRELSFPRQLGLDGGGSHVVFDFWKQQTIGVFGDAIRVEVEPHDTRVLFIFPLLDHPQLVGGSRHISGTYSLLDLKWDAARNTIAGSSLTVPGDDYSLWFHLPKNVKVSGVRAVGSNDAKLPVKVESAADSLKVSFTGETDPVRWEVRFSR